MKTLMELNSSLSEIASEQDELNIGYVSDNYDRYTEEFKVAVRLLHETVGENDKIAIQCALTRVRIASLNLSNVYQDIIDDVMLINKYESWPAIPDGYKLPEKYNQR
jgi:hypothetical protein